MFNKKTLMIAVPVIAVIAVIALALALNPKTGEKDIEAVLTKYFEAYYKTGSVTSLKECLPLEVREEADLAYTLGGSLNLLANYTNDTKAQIGDNVSVDVSIFKKTEPTAALRDQYKAQFHNGSIAITVGCHLDRKGVRLG